MEGNSAVPLLYFLVYDGANTMTCAVGDFIKRLDHFDAGYYLVGNEPCFQVRFTSEASDRHVAPVPPVLAKRRVLPIAHHVSLLAECTVSLIGDRGKDCRTPACIAQFSCTDILRKSFTN